MLDSSSGRVCRRGGVRLRGPWTGILALVLTACGGLGPIAPDDADGPGVEQPGTTSPLTIVAMAPAAGAVDVPVDAVIEVAFSRPVDSATVAAASFSVARTGEGENAPVDGAFSFADSNLRAIFRPDSPLASGTTYEIVLTDDIRAADGARLTGARSTFTTASAAAVHGDPEGDVFPAPESAGLVLPDLVAVAVEQDETALEIVLVFAESVSPQAASPRAVGGFIDLDVDQDASTGSPEGAVDLFRPDAPASADLGVEYVVHLLLGGVGLVVDAVRDQEVGSIGVRFGGNVVTLTVPYALLGGDEGNVDLAVIVGTRQDVTDIAPDRGHLAVGMSP